MSDALYTRLQALLGPGGVERDPKGLPRAVPESDDALAMVCALASEEGWKLRLEGAGTWLAADAPADLSLSTRSLNRLIALNPADLVATVQSGMPIESLQSELAAQGMWLAMDPPGRPERTIGSIVATGTAGPLRLGFGPVRDHVLGCTAATGDGRLVSAGGRVVKNVAGYDLTKLHVGGFGGFGVIAELHVRLRALPEVDLTLLTRGKRDAMVRAGRDAREAQTAAVALELFAPALAADAEWVLAARLIGAAAAVEAERERLAKATGLAWDPVSPQRETAFWGLAARGALAGPLTLRLGVLFDGMDDALDLVKEHLDEGLVSAGPGSGSIRWTGDVPADRLVILRRIAATREIPVTLERAPWAIRQSVGHFGAYREGVGQLVGRLRETFDPRGCLSVALEGSDT
ncbi:MAG TPA: FAD-binding oxidoreductase [Gemmatimonadales bacterium]|nr:FAD-binding oxidoreductase [Gemmatimonadales bacterium]